MPDWLDCFIVDTFFVERQEKITLEGQSSRTHLLIVSESKLVLES